jgi:hypothetical protein
MCKEGEGMFCINCGYNLGSGGAYCPRCGIEVEYEPNEGIIYSHNSRPLYRPRRLERAPLNDERENRIENQKPNLAFNIVSVLMLISAAVGMSLLTALEDKDNIGAISKFIDEEKTKKIIDLDLDSDGTYVEAD